ncbi:MAG: DUF4339 domain-containing protein [Acidobacteriaceae bacterium]|nr:DUF4339 domain-containing protein [Acidobacteriaceae bacterium]
MKYFLQRDGRNFGPYSLDDLKRYQSEGRIGPDDLIRAEDSETWIPQTEFFNPPAAPVVAPSPVLMPPAPAPVVVSAPTPSTPVTPPADNPFAAPGAGLGAGFGAPPASTPFSAPPAQQGFGAPPAGAGFGAPPAANPFPAPPAQQGFGTPPAAPGFGTPPAAPGFGGPPAGGFGGPPAGGFGMPAAGGFGAAQNPAASGAWPAPPDMQWYLVLILGIVSCNLFTLYWIYNQCQFVKKLDSASKALMFYLSGFGVMIGGGVLSGILTVLLDDTGMEPLVAVFAPIFNLGGTVLLILGHFNMRSSMERHYNTAENIGLKLSPIMTFFFSFLYFQYHFTRIAEWKKTGRLA